MFEANADTKDDVVNILATANVLMEYVNLAVKNWMVTRKQTPTKAIYAILL